MCEITFKDKKVESNIDKTFIKGYLCNFNYS